jgi:hypothetical protein
MHTINDDVREQVAEIILRAWPCYQHYQDPAELVGDEEAIRFVLTQIDALEITGERPPVPTTLPTVENIEEQLVFGNESTLGCLRLARAVTRCVPALTQVVGEGGAAAFANCDEYATRAALSDIHRRHHRLDPSDDDDTPLIEALCSSAPYLTPIEVAVTWQYMVRVTQDEVMGGPLGAFDHLPMRCFTDIEPARTWAAMLSIWECRLMEMAPEEIAADAAQTRLVSEIAGHDGSPRTWRLPVTNTTLRFTSRQAPPAAPPAS